MGFTRRVAGLLSRKSLSVCLMQINGGTRQRQSAIIRRLNPKFCDKSVAGAICRGLLFRHPGDPVPTGGRRVGEKFPAPVDIHPDWLVLRKMISCLLEGFKRLLPAAFGIVVIAGIPEIPDFGLALTCLQPLWNSGDTRPCCDQFADGCKYATTKMDAMPICNRIRRRRNQAAVAVFRSSD